MTASRSTTSPPADPAGIAPTGTEPASPASAGTESTTAGEGGYEAALAEAIAAAAATATAGPASQDPSPAERPRPPTLVEAFVRSAHALSDSMLGGQLIVCPPEWRDGGAVDPDCEVAVGGERASAGSAVSCEIEWTGELVGSVVLTFEPRAAELLAQSFTGMPLAFGTPDLADAVGELGNMLVGAAKARLPHAARISTPAVSVRPANGPPPELRGRSGWMAIPCRTPAGRLEVAIDLHDLRATDRQAA